MKSVPAIFDPRKIINKNYEIINATSPVSILWRSSRKRVFREDQNESFCLQGLRLRVVHV